MSLPTTIGVGGKKYSPSPHNLDIVPNSFSRQHIGSLKRLRQQTLKQPVDLPRGLPHPPPQRLDPRHHACKLFLQFI
jgi:hypothetical protein